MHQVHHETELSQWHESFPGEEGIDEAFSKEKRKNNQCD